MGGVIMKANDLIFSLRKSGFSIGSHDNRLQIAPAGKLTEELKQSIRQSKTEILTELQREARAGWRRQKVISMLKSAPDSQRAIYTDTDCDPHDVILIVAIRNYQKTYEMRIAKDKYDRWRLLELIERLGQTTH